jgi:hypothetical protein
MVKKLNRIFDGGAILPLLISMLKHKMPSPRSLVVYMPCVTHIAWHTSSRYWRIMWWIMDHNI